jgi:site-specific recombinase XerD
MNLTVQALLRELHKRRSSELVFPSNRKPAERIFGLKKGFKRAVLFAKLEPYLRFHVLRHTLATRLVDRGANIVTVQHLLGHARISKTVCYAHSPDATRIAAVEKLDGIFNSQNGPQSAPRAVFDGQGELLKSIQANSLGS